MSVLQKLNTYCTGQVWNKFWKEIVADTWHICGKAICLFFTFWLNVFKIGTYLTAFLQDRNTRIKKKHRLSFRAFAHSVMAAISILQNNKTVAMLVTAILWELNSFYVRTIFCSKKLAWLLATWVKTPISREIANSLRILWIDAYQFSLSLRRNCSKFERISIS